MGKISDKITYLKRNDADSSKMSFKEYYSYAIASFGYSSMAVMTSGYVLLFYTAIGLSTEVATSIMAFTKLWDSINDPVVATLIDNGKNPRGKFRPYIVKFAPLVAIFSIFMFTQPPVGGNERLKIFYCAITYVVWETFNTIAGLSFNAMPAVMSRDVSERTTYMTLGNIGLRIAGAVPGLIPLGYDVLVKNNAILSEATFFTVCTLVFSGMGCAAAMFSVNLKERVIPPKQTHFWESFVTFIKNKPLILLWSANIPGIISKIGQGSAAFFFIHSLGSYSYQTLLWVVSGIPSTFATVLAPYFIKRFRPSRLVIISNIMTALPMFIMYLIVRPIGYSSKIGLILYVAFTALSGISYDIRTVVINVCKVNTYDYGEWKTGRRAEATSIVVTGMLDKLIDAIGTLLMGKALKKINFAEGEGAQQSQQTKDGLFMFNALSPALGTLLSSIPYIFFKMDGENFEKIKKELDSRMKNNIETEEVL